jgi:hypothetical protein
VLATAATERRGIKEAFIVLIRFVTRGERELKSKETRTYIYMSGLGLYCVIWHVAHAEQKKVYKYLEYENVRRAIIIR